MNGERRGLHLYLLTALDLVVAVVVLVVFWGPSLVKGDLPLAEAVLGWALAAVTGIAMVVRWRMPSLAAAVAVGASVAGVALGLSTDPFLGAAWALYPLAVERGFRRGWVRISLFLFVVALAVFASVPTKADPVISTFLLGLAVIACSWTLGSGTGERVEIAAKAAQEHAERMSAEQRLDAAREIHDVVANTLGTIGVEAAVAAHVDRSSDRELRASLAEIADSSRDALGQVRQLVTSLRAGDAAGVRVAPTLAQLDALFERARVAGVPITARIRDVDGLDQVEQMTVFRIIQEAVTNVVRHAPGSRCDVDVRRAGEWTIVTVDDDGPGLDPQAPNPGHGILGMRERAAFAGGVCAVGTRPGGGVRVRAELPFHRATDASEGDDD